MLLFLLIIFYKYMYIICQLPIESQYTRHTRQSNSQLPKDGNDIWPKHAAVVYTKHKNIEQVVGCDFVTLFFNL